MRARQNVLVGQPPPATTVEHAPPGMRLVNVLQAGEERPVSWSVQEGMQPPVGSMESAKWTHLVSASRIPVGATSQALSAITARRAGQGIPAPQNVVLLARLKRPIDSVCALEGMGAISVRTSAPSTQVLV